MRPAGDLHLEWPRGKGGSSEGFLEEVALEPPWRTNVLKGIF